MRTVSTPHEIREDEHLWIPMRDGVRLAARIWRPTWSDDQPVPAVLEYIPYRKRDLTAHRDSMLHPYVAGHGYACARVDLRGSGDSEGVLTDEYLEIELQDGCEVLEWLAAQPWCDGTAGMIGKSWGGFNGLQIAARQPPQLQAVVAVAFSDDRYADDVHYMGGCLLGDNLSWASTMFAMSCTPPDPALVGDRWREMWRERLEHAGPWVDQWLEHQRRDDYWSHGSVRDDYSQVRCPVLGVSGWADGYSNAVFRLLEGLNGPSKGLIGPWSHTYPHMGQPGPAVGFLQEVVRWWDRWLKGVDNGIDDEPPLRVWMQESMPPDTSYESRPGRWVGEPSWPSPNIRTDHSQLGAGHLAHPGEEVPERGLSIESPLSVGLFGGKWCSYNAPPDLPFDQREEDGGSLVFDSAPLAERLEVLGRPVVHLELRSSQPVAMVAVRLSDVAPNGEATRVTYGLLNLTHRNGHGEPKALDTTERFHVAVPLNGVAQAFPAGHRIRISVSTSYWPLAWPPPRPSQLTVFTAASTLEMPVRTPRPDEDAQLAPLGEPEGADPIRVSTIRPGEHRWNVIRDLAEHVSALEVLRDEGTLRFDNIDLAVSQRAWERYASTANVFDSAMGETEWTMSFSRGDWAVEVVTRTRITCTEDAFDVHARLDAFEGDDRVHSANWQRRVPRDHV